MIVHLIDGTYELFRQFYGIRRGRGMDPPLGAVAGVLNTVAQMLESDATHVGVATDHVIESFRNGLWPGYKTGEGMDPSLWAQFHPLEEALAAMGVAVWPMVELEADDALASAAHLAAADPRVEKVCIWTPDKDLSQCVVGDRVVQVDRKSGKIRDAHGVREKFGVEPERIPDYLALVGDAAAFVDPLTGEGLFYAMRSGELLGKAIAEGHPQMYTDWVRASFSCELEFAARIVRRFYRGTFLGTAVTTRMVQFLRRSTIFRQIMADIFSGTQDYTTLKQRVVGHLGMTLSDFVTSVLNVDAPAVAKPRPEGVTVR